MTSLFQRTPLAPLVPVLGEWDPIARVRELMSWDPFQELGRTVIPPERGYAFVPAFDVKEAKDSYIIKADLPGIKEQDLDIAWTGNRLTVSGKREMEHKEKGETFFTYERAFGSFSRSFTLPPGVDGEHAKAELKEGVLTLMLPKAPEVQSKKIQIKAGEKVKA